MEFKYVQLSNKSKRRKRILNIIIQNVEYLKTSAPTNFQKFP